MTRRHRRDILLDSHGITALASDASLLAGYLRLLETRYDGALLVPIPVITEAIAGRRRHDVLTERLLKTIGPAGHIPLTAPIAKRAGVLRAEAVRRASRRPSAVDAQVVAIAEARSLRNAVTIVTSDPQDIGFLIELTGRPNIACHTL